MPVPCARCSSDGASAGAACVCAASDSAEALLRWLASPEGGVPGVRVGPQEVDCRFVANDGEQAAFFQRVGAAGVGVVAMREIEASIEDVVLGLHQPGGSQ